MTSEFRSGSKQRWKYILRPLVKLSVVIVIATIIAVVWFNVTREHLLVVVGGAWAWFLLIRILPLLVIAIRHDSVSKDACFSVNSRSGNCHYEDKDGSISFVLTDLVEVIRVVSPPTYDRRFDWLGFGYFYYWKFVLADGRVLVNVLHVIRCREFLGKNGEPAKANISNSTFE